MMDMMMYYKTTNIDNPDMIIINDIDKNKNSISKNVKFIEYYGGGYIENDDNQKKNIEENILNFPVNLESIFVNGSRCVDYNFLPNKLKILIIYTNKVEPLINLPPNLEEVKITTYCNLEIILPDGKKYLI
jgi:hypothetical protein